MYTVKYAIGMHLDGVGLVGTPVEHVRECATPTGAIACVWELINLYPDVHRGYNIELLWWSVYDNDGNFVTSGGQYEGQRDREAGNDGVQAVEEERV